MENNRLNNSQIRKALLLFVVGCVLTFILGILTSSLITKGYDQTKCQGQGNQFDFDSGICYKTKIEKA